MNRRKFLGAAAMMAAAVPGSRMGAAVGGPRLDRFVRMRSISRPGERRIVRGESQWSNAGQRRFSRRQLGHQNHQPQSLWRFVDAQLRSAVRLREAGDEPGPGGLGRGHARGQGRVGHGLHPGLSRFSDRQRSHAGGASLAVDVCSHFLSRRPADWLCHVGHRSGACGIFAAKP